MLYEADFPQSKKPVNEQANRALEKKYQVRGYPTIIIADAAGKPLGQTGYTGAKPGEYIQSLTLYSDFIEGKRKLDQSKDAAQRKALAERVIPLAQKIGKLALVAEHVRAHDPKNEKGLLVSLVAEEATELHLQDAQRALDKLTAFEAAHAVGTGEGAQRFHLAKANCHYRLKQTAKMRAALKLAVKAAPKTELGQNIQRWLDRQQQK